MTTNNTTKPEIYEPAIDERSEYDEVDDADYGDYGVITTETWIIDKESNY